MGVLKKSYRKQQGPFIGDLEICFIYPRKKVTYFSVLSVNHLQGHDGERVDLRGGKRSYLTASKKGQK